MLLPEAGIANTPFAVVRAWHTTAKKTIAMLPCAFPQRRTEFPLILQATKTTIE